MGVDRPPAQVVGWLVSLAQGQCTAGGGRSSYGISHVADASQSSFDRLKGTGKKIVVSVKSSNVHNQNWIKIIAVSI